MQIKKLKPVPAKLHYLISEFLAEKRRSEGGGWAQIEESDLRLLEEIIDSLIKSKCEKDADGDTPIQYRLVNRRTHQPLFFSPMRYSHKCETAEDFEPLLRIASGNLSQAHSDLQTVLKCREFVVNQNKKKE